MGRDQKTWIPATFFDAKREMPNIPLQKLSLSRDAKRPMSRSHSNWSCEIPRLFQYSPFWQKQTAYRFLPQRSSRPCFPPKSRLLELGNPSCRGRFSDPSESIVSGAFANGRNFFDKESTHDRPLKSTSNEDKVQPCPSVSSVHSRSVDFKRKGERVGRSPPLVYWHMTCIGVWGQRTRELQDKVGFSATETQIIPNSQTRPGPNIWRTS